MSLFPTFSKVFEKFIAQQMKLTILIICTWLITTSTLPLQFFKNITDDIYIWDKRKFFVVVYIVISIVWKFLGLCLTMFSSSYPVHLLFSYFFVEAARELRTEGEKKNKKKRTRIPLDSKFYLGALRLFCSFPGPVERVTLSQTRRCSILQNHLW